MVKQLPKLSNKNTIGVSFYFNTIKCSVNNLIKILGETICFNNRNFEWVCETSSGGVFTVYNEEEHYMCSKTKNITWHIGGYNKSITIQAEIELRDMLKNKVM